MTYYKTKLLQHKMRNGGPPHHIETVIRTRRYIDQHYHEDLKLDMLARYHFISKYHLLRLFKKYYGLTPRQYLIQRRIEKSKKLLENGNSAAETCYRVGFESPNSFSTLFRKRIGRTPSQYQKSNFR